MWSSITPWVVVRVFHLSVPATVSRSGGSGDTALGYAERFCILAAAVSAAILWSVLDRRRKNYHELHLWLRIYLRYLLAFVLFSYGFVKIFPLQMPPPTFARLIEPYGEFSPMGVLWSFIGVSTAYSLFSGAAEVLGGMLLVFGRTAMLGSLVSFGNGNALHAPDRAGV